MNGSQALITSLVDAGVEVCFMNPGTSEMHFVHALDSVPRMRGVLALFEGVATGAADGYARVAGRPAAVLLHLGPGLGNGLANLHNARRARTPLLCVVGAHATYHARYDALLESDIAAVARTVSGWVHTSGTTRGVAADAMRALAAAQADGGQAMLLLGGRGLSAAGLEAASRVAAATGARVLAETFPARMEAGAGVPATRRLAYLAEQAEQQLDGVRTLVLAGAAAPVSFFAYPGRTSSLVPDGCEVVLLAETGQDVAAALEALADRVAADTAPELAAYGPAVPEPGPLNLANLPAAIASTLPDGAVVVDEANTSGLGLPTALARAARHTLLTLTGGAIGQGMPVAT